MKITIGNSLIQFKIGADSVEFMIVGGYDVTLTMNAAGARALRDAMTKAIVLAEYATDMLATPDAAPLKLVEKKP